MEPQVRKVRHDIKTTREALTDKIEMLETQAQETMQNTKTKIKQTFDLSYHVDQRPWTMMGAAIAIGYLLKSSTTSSQDKTENSVPYGYEDFQPLRSMYGNNRAEVHTPPTSATTPQSEQYSQRKNGSFFDQFQDEFTLVKGAAVGAVANLMRDLVKQALPQLTTSLQSVFQKSPASQSQRQDSYHNGASQA